MTIFRGTGIKYVAPEREILVDRHLHRLIARYIFFYFFPLLLFNSRIIRKKKIVFFFRDCGPRTLYGPNLFIYFFFWHRRFTPTHMCYRFWHPVEVDLFPCATAERELCIFFYFFFLFCQLVRDESKMER